VLSQRPHAQNRTVKECTSKQKKQRKSRKRGKWRVEVGKKRNEKLWRIVLSF